MQSKINSIKHHVHQFTLSQLWIAKNIHSCLAVYYVNACPTAMWED